MILSKFNNIRREKFNIKFYGSSYPIIPNLFKKIKMKKKMILKFWKFCNSASCLHNMLSQRTAASNTECKIINKKAEDLN